MHLSVTLALAAAFLTACAQPTPGPAQRPPASIVWAEPESGQALVYFLRTPLDRPEVTLTIDGEAVLNIPANTYGSRSLSPGKHRLSAVAIESDGSSTAVLELELKPNERRFVYMSKALPNPPGMGFATVAGGVTISGQLGARSVPENYKIRRWLEFSELDARGLASISYPMP
jgi:hypothetical protein